MQHVTVEKFSIQILFAIKTGNATKQTGNPMYLDYKLPSINIIISIVH